MIVDLLRQQWTAMLENRAPAQGVGEAVFSEIVKAYAARSRHYHNLQHLADLFRQFETYRTRLKNKDLVAASIFFHDVVYRPTRRGNEAKSAEYAAKRLPQLGFQPEETQLVSDFIRATHRHELPGSPHPDLPWFLDFDLAILGAPWETYLDYTRKIRREYQIYPDLLYVPGRRQAMEQFLLRLKIYFTQAFQDMFEASARANIRQEIA